MMPYVHGGAVTATEYVVEVLGGAKVFRGRGVPDPAQLRVRIQEGLPYSALDALRERLHLSLPETSRVLDTPVRTLARRRRERKLQAAESDRLYRVARVYAQAVQVLGAEDRAAEWLRRPNRALNGEPPLELLDTELGSRQVEDVLGRLEYGVFS
jgi:putative toxin-antitoxin system antitoxin component (TIGR02293 family)